MWECGRRCEGGGVRQEVSLLTDRKLWETCSWPAHFLKHNGRGSDLQAGRVVLLPVVLHDFQ